MSDPSTRQAHRQPVTLKIKFKSETLEQFIERYAVDVSPGGIFVRTKEPLAIGTTMKFEFQLKDSSPLIGGDATVVWRRDNDPARPAIAPGMGVRFDRLSDGSRSVLDRILAGKPVPGGAAATGARSTETPRSPAFMDSPTRIAPVGGPGGGGDPDGFQEQPTRIAPMGGDAFLEQPTRIAPADLATNLVAAARASGEGDASSPVPFESDAGDFGAEMFSEATKIRNVDDLIAATVASGGSAESVAALKRAIGGGLGSSPAAPTASGPVAVSGTVESKAPAPAAVAPIGASPLAVITAPEAAPTFDREARPVPREEPKVLATTSPASRAARTSATTGEGAVPSPVRVDTPRPVDAPPAVKDSPARATPRPRTPTAPAARTSSMGIVIALLVLAAIGAAVWFVVLRTQDEPTAATRGQTPPPSTTTRTSTPPATDPPANAGSDVAVNAGSAVAPDPTPQPNAPTQPGPAIPNPPVAASASTTITASVPDATVTIDGTAQSGPAPFVATAEKGKPFKAIVTAPGFVTAELTLTGGDATGVAKLVAKPYVLAITSEPSGAVISINGSPSGQVTPAQVTLTSAQLGKPIRIQLRKSGYERRTQMSDPAAFVESDTLRVQAISARLDKAVREPATAPFTPGTEPAPDSMK